MEQHIPRDEMLQVLERIANILVGPGSRGDPELQRTAVSGVSLDPLSPRAALTVARNLPQALLTNRAYTSVESALSYAEVNRLGERPDPLNSA
jgi:hypothetical protein